MSSKRQYERERARSLDLIAAQKRRSEATGAAEAPEPRESSGGFYENSSLEDKQRSRATAGKILGLAEDFRRGPYPADGQSALNLSSAAWIAKEIERCADALESIAASLCDQSPRNEPLGSNFSAAPGTSAPETVSEGIEH